MQVAPVPCSPSRRTSQPCFSCVLPPTTSQWTSTHFSTSLSPRAFWPPRDLAWVASAILLGTMASLYKVRWDSSPPPWPPKLRSSGRPRRRLCHQHHCPFLRVNVDAVQHPRLRPWDSAGSHQSTTRVCMISWTSDLWSGNLLRCWCPLM